LREDAIAPVSAYLKSMLGGASNLPRIQNGNSGRRHAGRQLDRVARAVTSPLSIAKVGVSAFVDVAKPTTRVKRFGTRNSNEGGGAIWFARLCV